MVCPYCGTRNTPNVAICSNCGVILALAKEKQRFAEKAGLKSLILPALIFATLAMMTGIVGLILAHKLEPSDRNFQLGGLAIGAIAGLVIVWVVSGGRVLLYSYIFRNQARHLAGEVRHRHSVASKHIDDLGKQQPADAHVQRGVLALVDDELDTSLQQFDQAQRLHAESSEFMNDYGVALAMRGSLDSAVDKFNQALGADAGSDVPRINIANALLLTRDNSLAERAVNQLAKVLQNPQVDPSCYFRYSAALVRAGKTRDAIEQANKGLAVVGKSAAGDAHNLIGVAHLRDNKVKEATDEFRAALAADPGHSHAIANQGVVMLEQRRTSDAVAMLQTAVKADPKLAGAHNNYGCALVADGAINEGIRELRESIVLNPLQIESQYNVGKSYADAGVYMQAERYFLTSLKINPRLWQACVGMGIIYYHVGPVEKALTWYREAERLAPYEASVVGGLALCNALHGDLLEAERLYVESIKHDSRNPENLANLGWIYIQMEKYNEAADFIERASKHTDRSAAVFNNLALCNLHMGATEVALRYFRRALDTDPKLGTVHYNLGHVYHSMKSPDQALKEWVIATEQEPGLADAFANVGVSYYRVGKFEQALKAFQKAVLLRQDRMEDYLNLGLAFARLQKHKEAIEQFDKAIVLDRNNPMVHSNRGLACYFAKRVEEAMNEWRTVAHLSAAYYQSRGKKQQSEYDESAIDFVPLYINERAVHLPPGSGDFLYAMLPGFAASNWQLVISDENIKPIPELKARQAHVIRQLNALKIG